MGANNVSNAIGTSVGSGAVSVRNGLILAAIFEFLGTSLMGGMVTGTLKTAIISPLHFAANPEYFALGMFSTMCTAVVWILLATHYALPISATQTIIGGIVGFAIVENSFQHVNHSALALIVLSWFLSPIVGALFSYALYYTIHKLVLEKGELHKLIIPAYYGATFSILIGFILYSNMKTFNYSLNFVLFCVILLFGVISLFVTYTRTSTSWYGLATRSAVDPEQLKKADAGESELPFKILMVVSAAFVAFAHGSNDVSNAAAPFAAMVEFKNFGEISTSTDRVPYSVILGCGVGIVVGLLALGYKTLATVGEKITKLTYSKGYAAQVCGAFTILLASSLSMPISTTAILIGGIVGAGLVGEEGGKALDKEVLLKIVGGWVVTVLVGLIGTPIIYLVLKAIAL
eukprot:TRINITY_DN2496_c0_g1_i2.p1 TRINITY_DN2496_c0_g1~~TRINITY_DN2496_c0_g1_i2.p1  ORF type:complete len:403 (-),score=72.03 TRINITY_DN2496_c0_g1_i2:8-1216(-)